MLTGIIIGLLAGIIIGFLIIYLAMPSLMFKENRFQQDFDTTVARVEETVVAKGWKVPHIHDLQATLKKFGKDVRSVKILEMCHPDHSYEILSRDDERIVSNLMPCRIAVYEKMDSSVWISRMIVRTPCGCWLVCLNTLAVALLIQRCGTALRWSTLTAQVL